MSKTTAEIDTSTDAQRRIAPVVTCEQWEMAARMAANEDVFFALKDDGAPVIFAIANDTFAYACADAEIIPWDEVETTYELWEDYGWAGLLIWMCQKRKCKPIDPVYERYKTLIDAYT